MAEQPYNFNEAPLRLNYSGSSPAGKGPQTEMSRDSARSGVSINSMLDVKNTRKRTEADLQLLANRIALLKMEEERAKFKVEETKRRADDITKLKKRNQDVIEKRQQDQLAKEIREKNLRDRVQMEKEIRKKKVETTRKLVADSRREEAIRIKKAVREQINETEKNIEQFEQQNHEKAIKQRKR